MFPVDNFATADARRKKVNGASRVAKWLMVAAVKTTKNGGGHGVRDNAQDA